MTLAPLLPHDHHIWCRVRGQGQGPGETGPKAQESGPVLGTEGLAHTGTLRQYNKGQG